MVANVIQKAVGGSNCVQSRYTGTQKLPAEIPLDMARKAMLTPTGSRNQYSTLIGHVSHPSHQRQVLLEHDKWGVLRALQCLLDVREALGDLATVEDSSEKLAVEIIWLDCDRGAQREPRLQNLLGVIDGHSLPRWDARVEELAGEIERHLSPNHRLFRGIRHRLT